MLAYLHALFSSDADVTRASLLYGSLAGGIIVVIGLIWESGKLTLATAVVIVGVCLESFCTWRLFVVDEGISLRQQATIEQLEAQRQLTDGQKKRIADVAGLHRLSFVVFTNPETEAWNLALQIGETLKADGWTWEPCAIASRPSLQAVTGAPAECTTLVDHIEVDAPPNLLPVADALANAIREPDVYGMDRVWPDPNAKTGVMTIMVGSKR